MSDEQQRLVDLYGRQLYGRVGEERRPDTLDSALKFDPSTTRRALETARQDQRLNQNTIDVNPIIGGGGKKVIATTFNLIDSSVPDTIFSNTKGPLVWTPARQTYCVIQSPFTSGSQYYYISIIEPITFTGAASDTLIIKTGTILSTPYDPTTLTWNTSGGFSLNKSTSGGGSNGGAIVTNITPGIWQIGLDSSYQNDSASYYAMAIGITASGGTASCAGVQGMTLWPA